MQPSNLRTEAEALALAREIARELGVDEKWRIKVNRRLRLTLARCVQNHTRGKYLIELASPYCMREEESKLRITIMHECAHALVGCEHHHGRVWQLKMREIGLRPTLGQRASPGTVPGWHAWCDPCGGEFLGSYPKRPRDTSRCARCRHTPLRIERVN